MIYLDNAATTFKKPKSVSLAMLNSMVNFGANAGRGGYALARKAAEKVYDTRELLCEFFGIDNTQNLAFFPNTTYALNAAIYGVLADGGHAVITSMEHNSVIRPLAELEKTGKVHFTVVTADSEGRINPDDIDKAIRPDTRLLIMTGASNVCGNIYDIEKAADIAHKRGVPILVDGAQIAGFIQINAKKYDMFAFPGHKGLMGPQGTGGLILAPHIKLKPLISGGTGSMSENMLQPETMPDRLESGTINMPAISGLYEGVKFIMKEGLDAIYSKENELLNFAYSSFKNMENITCYGDFENRHAGVLSFNIEGKDSVWVSNELDERFSIAVRGGLHCSPFAHKTLGTMPRGTVRMSFGYFNTKNEVKRAVDAIYKLSK